MALYNTSNYLADRAAAYRPNTLRQPDAPRQTVFGYNTPTKKVAVPASNTSYNPAWAATIPNAPATENNAAPTPYLGSTITPETTIGLSPEERSRIYNQARLNFTGAMRQGVGEMSNMMGGRGFVPGESGLADTAIGSVYSKGLSDLGGVMQGIATDEAKNRFAQGLALDQLKMQQNQWAQEFGANRQDQSTADLLNLLNLYQTSQAGVYAPYYGTLGASITGGA